MADGGERVAEEEPRPLDGAEQVADHREGATLDALEQQRRPGGLVDAPLDFGHFQARVDFLADPDQPAGAFQVGDTLVQGAMAHASPHGGKAKVKRQK